MPVSLDATYSIGASLSGVGVYSDRILRGLSAAHPEERFHWYYRPHRFLRSFKTPIPANCARRILLDGFAIYGQLFHGLNQRLPRTKLHRAVTTFHDLFVLTGDYSSPEFRRRFTALARDAAQRSDLVISVSEFTASQVHALLGVERSRLRVVHHGVDVPELPPGTREKIILHVGAIQKRKNIERLVAAFERVGEPWKLALAGSAGYGSQQILQFIERSHARSRIEVRGYVSAKELHGLYRKATVLAFPSLDEGFGIPVLEAMAYQVPVLASNTSSLPEICGGAALLVDPADVDSIASGLRELTENEALRNELANKGTRRAALFPWSQAVSKTWEVYRELL